MTYRVVVRVVARVLMLALVTTGCTSTWIVKKSDLVAAEAQMKKDSSAIPLVEAHHADGTKWLRYQMVRGQEGKPLNDTYVEVTAKDSRPALTGAGYALTVLGAMMIAGGVAAILDDHCDGFGCTGSVLGAISLWTAGSLTSLGGLTMIITSSAIRGPESKTGPPATTLGLGGTF